MRGEDYSKPLSLAKNQKQNLKEDMKQKKMVRLDKAI